MSASAFSLTITLPQDGLELIAGEPIIGGLHGPVTHHFHCPHCLSWLFTRAEGMDWFVNLRPSVLDQHGWFTPFVELWTSEKLPWATTGAVHSYEKVPDMAEFAGLIEAFSE